MAQNHSASPVVSAPVASGKTSPTDTGPLPWPQPATKSDTSPVTGPVLPPPTAVVNPTAGRRPPTASVEAAKEEETRAIEVMRELLVGSWLADLRQRVQRLETDRRPATAPVGAPGTAPLAGASNGPTKEAFDQLFRDVEMLRDEMKHFQEQSRINLAHLRETMNAELENLRSMAVGKRSLAVNLADLAARLDHESAGVTSPILPGRGSTEPLGIGGKGVDWRHGRLCPTSEEAGHEKTPTTPTVLSR